MVDAAVVMIDDDTDLLDVMREAIETFCSSKSILSFVSLEQAQAQSEKVMKCNLAIIDVNLGYGKPNGVDVVNWLLKSGFSGKLVFLTGHAKSDPEVISISQIAGADILEKPIDVDKLINLINK